MTLFPSLPNLSSIACSPVCPWEFQGPIPDEVRSYAGRTARTEWINSRDTHHNCFFAFEGTNPNLRISKGASDDDSNPPYKLVALIADYDAPITSIQSVNEAMARVAPFAPNYMGRSLSGNAHFIWLLEAPVLVPSRAFAVHFLSYILTQTKIESLHVCFDKGHFTDPARALTNGCDWQCLSADRRISSSVLNGWLAEAGHKFLWSQTSGHGIEIPLDIVEGALREKYPNFKDVWPGEFVLGAQGPTFWVPQSTSPMSAIVRETGIQTFAAHATRPFYTWSDLLGATFVKNYKTKSLGDAVKGIYHDGKSYFRQLPGGLWRAVGKDDLRDHLNATGGLNTRKLKGTPSECDLAIQHVQNYAPIDGAAPFAFKPQGIIHIHRRPFLNTFTGSVLNPAEGEVVWGAAGQFPWVSNFFAGPSGTPTTPHNGFFADTETPDVHQLVYFLAWLKRLYGSAHALDLQSGQNVILVGDQSRGKTFLSNALLGRLLGGAIDARDYLMGDDSFGGHLFERALWTIDDAVMNSSLSTHKKFSEMMKKMSANKTFQFHMKFRTPLQVDWQGRVFVTTNTDAESMRVIPDLDRSNLDKLMLFLANGTAEPGFRTMGENHATLDAELPYFARWLLDWTPPQEVMSDNPRYGVKSYHENALVRSAGYSSRSAGFRELIDDFLSQLFAAEPKTTEWRGSATKLYRRIGELLGDAVLRSYSSDDFTRRLAGLHATGYPVTYEDGSSTREWIFQRSDSVDTAPLPTTPTPAQKTNSAFSK